MGILRRRALREIASARCGCVDLFGHLVRCGCLGSRTCPRRYCRHFFPPGFYIFAIRAIVGWENHLHPTNALQGDPDNNLRLLPLLIIALVNADSVCLHLNCVLTGIHLDQCVSLALLGRSPREDNLRCSFPTQELVAILEEEWS